MPLSDDTAPDISGATPEGRGIIQKLAADLHAAVREAKLDRQHAPRCPRTGCPLLGAQERAGEA
jgi:hypothetical protein